jgi:hypothetical protein
MLRREADGVRWWRERGQLLGRNVEAQAMPMLALRFTSFGAPEAVVQRARELVVLLDDSEPWSSGEASRSMVNGFFGGFDHDAGPWSDALFERIAARVSQPDGQGMSLDWSMAISEQARGVPRSSGIGLSFSSVDQEVVDPVPWEWALQASPGLFHGEALDQAAAVWTRMLETVATWAEVPWGAVLFDVSYSNGPTPFEKYFSAPVSVEESAHAVRGYYWANLVTEAHVEAIGGLSALGTRCADAGVECHPVQGRAAAIIKCVQPIADLSEDQLVAMRDALQPLLPKAAYVWYEGPPLRVIREPGTAFRRIPPEIRVPWFDDDPPLSQGIGRSRQLVPDDEV